jgi:FG-GAP repeat/IPTL-CTERM motif
MLKYFSLLFLLVCFNSAYSVDFNEIIKSVASDRAASDYFGYSVSISGNYAIVGAYWEDEDENGANTASSAGSAYIFKLSGETWSEVDKIVASDRAASDFFGVSVAIDGDYAIVGATSEDEDENGANTASGAGSAYIFKRDSGADTWTEVDKIVASDRATNDSFGYSISIDGDYIIVSSFGEDEDENGANTASYAGSAYIFKRDSGTDTWTEVDKIVASDRAASDFFGISSAISGDYIVVGARGESEDENGANTLTDAGSAYLFKRDTGADTWTEVDKIVTSDRAASDYFGYSVAISGDYAIVGAIQESEDENGANTASYAGSAYIFKRDSGTDTWTEVDKIVASDRAASDIFGKSVAISGDYAIVGAYWEDEDENGANTASQAGSIYFFARSIDINSTSVSDIKASSAVLNANVYSPESSSTYTFELGTSTGVYTSTYTHEASTTLSSSDISVTATGLTGNKTTYYYKVTGIDGTNTTTTAEGTFTTVPTLGEWGMIAFASLMGIFGFFFVRKRMV